LSIEPELPRVQIQQKKDTLIVSSGTNGGKAEYLLTR